MPPVLTLISLLFGKNSCSVYVLQLSCCSFEVWKRHRSASDLYGWCYLIFVIFCSPHCLCCWLCFLFYWAKDTTECPRCYRGPFATVWPVSVGVFSSFTHDIEFEVRLKVVIRFANVFRLHTYLSLFLWSQQQHTKFETTVGQKADLVVSRFLEVT